jgi:hypothetical protein
MKGHFSGDCSIQMTWERPRYLEDLIPEEDRRRWNITTKTRIIHTPLTATTNLEAIAKNEIHPSMTYSIENQDKKIRAFMEKNLIKRHSKQVDNMREITQWCLQRGMRVEFTKEIIATN